MSFNQPQTVFYKYEDEKDGIRYEGSLPVSALAQYDIYMAMLAYWEARSPETWNTLRGYILANTKVSSIQGNIPLDLKKDLNFKQINVLITKYMEMATRFFTSPQKQESPEPEEIQ